MCTGTKEENEPLAEAMDVKSYPSIHIFHYQNFVKAYLGKPKKKNLRNFLLSSVSNSAEKKKEEEKIELKEKDEMKKEKMKEKKEKEVVDSKRELTEEEFQKMKIKKIEMKGKEEEEKRKTRRESIIQKNKKEETTTAAVEAPAPAPAAEKLPSVLSFNSLVLQQILRRDITIPFSKSCQILFLYSGTHPFEKELTHMYQQVSERIPSMSVAGVPKCVFLAADTDEDARVIKFFNVTKETTSIHISKKFLDRLSLYS